MAIPATPAARGTSVLLVDDQPIIGEAVRRMLAGEEGITLHYCKDATAAVEKAAEVEPTVILQDLVMPEVDGLELVRRYRADERFRDVPVIVLSTKEEPTVKAEAFALGANDYIVKLPDRLELIARVRHHSRGYIALAERNEAFRALQKSQQILANDLATAATYVRSLLPPPQSLGSIRADWRFIPSAALGGDAFGYHDLDADTLAVYLLDVCGHGVGAALLSVSALNAIRSEALPQTDFHRPADVLAALNKAFPMERQNDMFFTAWYGVFDRPSRRLRWAGGGHPPALLLPAGGGQRLLESEGPLIGAVEGLEFTADEVEVPPGSSLFVYSDGAFEISLPEGGMWPFDAFVETLAEASAGRRDQPAGAAGPLDVLLGRVRDLAGRADFHDDFSMLELVLG
ncbi:MAG: fused response regulator/phosphatase [Planctomycetota bacterium]|jgi:sigma-B regulation protein RsbU (phosphoserine phosphatase)|nr:fused response regulator/phosphatase [Planctomycetota bacterium]